MNKLIENCSIFEFKNKTVFFQININRPEAFSSLLSQDANDMANAHELQKDSGLMIEEKQELRQN